MKKRRPRIYRASKPQPLMLTPRREEVIRWVAKYSYLTSPQLSRLMGIGQSRVRFLLTDLKHGGEGKQFYLRACKFVPGTYILDYGGYNYLERLGCAPEGRFRPDVLEKLQPSFLAHTTDTIDLQILAELAKRQGIKIARVLSDHELHKRPMKVWVKKVPATIIPDTFIDFDLGDSKDHAYCFEVDRGTTEIKPWRQKLFGYLEAIKGEYQRKLEAQSIAIAVIVTSGWETTPQKRVTKLLNWCESVLTEAKAERYATLFYFADFDPDTITPNEAFLSPIWYQPFNREKATPLLGG